MVRIDLDFLFRYALVLKRLGLVTEALPYFVRTVKAVPHLWSAWEDLVALIDSEQKVCSNDKSIHNRRVFLLTVT